MANPDEFVSGGSVDWGGVAAGIVGAFVWLVGMAYSGFITMIGSAAQTALQGISNWTAAVIGTPFDGAEAVFETAWREWASFMTVLGPLAFPATVAMISVVVLLVIAGVSRFV